LEGIGRHAGRTLDKIEKLKSTIAETNRRGAAYEGQAMNGAAVEPGKRRLNWVWYVNIDQGPDLDRFLTTRTGERRTGSVGAGEMPDDVIEEIHKTAAKELHPRFAELIQATPDPFLQTIVDLELPRMAFGRACLLGHAAFVVRPHTAGATARAAADAMALAEALRKSGGEVTEGFKKYERQRIPAGRSMMSYGMRLGERSAATR
jgi:2-polyprenyl-6-methoxyphenol hydroxylase-like FAD-dependent oxidoreductase